MLLQCSLSHLVFCFGNITHIVRLEDNKSSRSICVCVGTNKHHRCINMTTSPLNFGVLKALQSVGTSSLFVWVFVCVFVCLFVCLCVCLLVCLFRTECTTGLGLTGPHVPPRQAGSTKHSFKSTSCLRTRCALTNVKKKNACPCNVRHKRVGGGLGDRTHV